MIGAAAIALALLADALALAALGVLVSLVFDAGAPAAGLAAVLTVLGAGFVLPRVVGAALDERRTTAALLGLALAIVYTAAGLEATGDLSAWTFRWLPDFYREPEATMRAGAPAVAATLILAAAWARGAIRSDQDFDLEGHPRTLFIPFAIVIAAAVLGAGSSRAGDLATLTAAFFAVAVLSLACAQLALGGATLGTVRAGGVAGALLGGVAAVAVVGFLLFGVAARLLGPTVVPAVGAAVEAVLIVVLTPVAWALTAIFEHLFGGIDPFEGLNRAIEQAGQQSRGEPAGDTSVAEQVGLFGLRTLALLVFVGLLAGIVLAWTRARRRYARLREASASAGAAGSLRDDIRSMLGALFRGRAGGRPSPGDSAAARLYLEVLDDAEHRGRPRQPSQTPHEFAPVLHQTFMTAVTDDITRAFELARYGGREPGPAELAELERRWRDVRRGPAPGGPTRRPGP